MTDTARHRINGSLLGNYKEKMVSIMGYCAETNPNGTSFRLKTTDEREVVIKLNQPLQECLDGLLQVEGKVNKDLTVACTRFSFPPENESDKFDGELYNELVQLMDKHPTYYPTM